MKAITIMTIVGIAILAIGAVAWAGGRGYGYGGYCSWRGAPALDQPQTTHQADGVQPIAHRHNCGHWWGWLVSGHRASCCTWDHGRRSGQWRSGSNFGGCW